MNNIEFEDSQLIRGMLRQYGGVIYIDPVLPRTKAFRICRIAGSYFGRHGTQPDPNLLKVGGTSSFFEDGCWAEFSRAWRNAAENRGEQKESR